MLLNASEVELLLQTNNKGARAQVGYDLTLKEIKQINGGIVLSDKTVVEDYTTLMPTILHSNKLIYKLEPGTYSLSNIHFSSWICYFIYSYHNKRKKLLV